MFSCVWLHFKKISGKYFLMLGKEEGNDKPKKISSTIAISVEGEIAINCAISLREIAIDASRDRAINRDLGRRRDCDQLRDLTTAREIAIDALRDHAVDRDLRSDRRTGAREIGAAWSSESAGDRRTDWNVSSPLARVRSLSLFPEML